MNKTVLKKSLGVSAVFAAGFLMVVGLVFASNEPNFTYEITEGNLAVDIVDAAGESVPTPVVDFTSGAFSSDVTYADAVLGVADAKIRAYNPTEEPIWNVTIAPENKEGVGSWAWNSVTDSYPIDAAAEDDGRMTIDPSTNGIIASDAGCELETGMSTGSAAFFLPTTTEEITLFSADAQADPYCRWDLTGVDVDQVIPAAQPVGEYSIPMVLTIS